MLTEKKIHLVFRGGSLDLMGAVSLVAHVGGSNVLGIIPRALTTPNLTVGKEIQVSTMHERVSKMLEKSDAFIALPGGYVTLVLLGTSNKLVGGCDEHLNVYSGYFVTCRGFTKGSFLVPLDSCYTFESELCGAIIAIECAKDFNWDHLWLEWDSTYVANLLSHRDLIVPWALKAPSSGEVFLTLVLLCIIEM
ncbi:hypothetical protein FNV43_RR05890 [Rhamnella rubrinervis]|uniref:cytokinin riboside 5'-monophosphate phosphoribohydrolase n=1 Tax=Rhamnella rubrinervis TaxID=2594499 RepID=A0A8K0MKT4_9ROSA|nr:hypothetical protein FNV43_RR05890 [Rhamnella rubrinervis]